MAKLYPPSIEGTIPAFFGERLTVPFVMNRTVSWTQVSGFRIMIKSITTNKTVWQGRTPEKEREGFDQENLLAFFDVPQGALKVGVSYKIQIAYIDTNDVIGYYSTVGVVKYTTQPTMEIVGFTPGGLHANSGSFLGKYSQKQEKGDATEKLYSYCFTVYDKYGAIFDTTGQLLHNHENDDEINESTDSYLLNKTLDEKEVYTIVYSGITTNNMEVSSPTYRIMQQTTVPPEIEASLVATMNEENGYVDISVQGDKDDTGLEISASGVFLLSRSCSKDDFKNWEEVERFALFGERPSTFTCRDFTVEHGFDYQYSLQQYNKEYQIYSNRMLSNTIKATFEHSFLYDGQKQLKIKFNPKVTSFKETVLESKTNTLGGKYPFFYRNGNVGYKEFPISGLISYQMDDEQLFLTNEEMFLDNNKFTREHTLRPDVKSTDTEYFYSLADLNAAIVLQNEYKKREGSDSQERQIANSKFRTHQLIDYNIAAERIFKMKVLEFLNDGKPKLFRSPAEGNYLVRLMNSSLSPNDQLGRMIHTFSTTATEIDGCDFRKLGEYNITTIKEPDTTQMRWKTVNIRDKALSIPEGQDFGSIGNDNNIYSVQFIDMIPGDKVKLISGNKEATGRNVVDIVIGATGAYSVTFAEPIDQVQISRLSRQGQVTYSYQDNALQKFDTYRAIHMADIPIRQFIGAYEDIRDELTDIKHVVTKYYFANFTKREIKVVATEEEWKNIKLEPEYLYLYNQTYYDGAIGIDTPVELQYKIWINGNEVDISDTDDYFMVQTELDLVPTIKTSSGIVADISVQRREIEYDVEENLDSKKDYLNALEILQQTIRRLDTDGKDKYFEHEEGFLSNVPPNNLSTFESCYQAYYSDMLMYYDIFIKEVEQALAEKEVLSNE